MIAILPARKNSKRFPGKNRASFNGIPLIELALRSASETNLFDEIYLNTDDEELAELAKKLGLSVPFMRPSELALDNTSTCDVINHAIRTLGYSGDLCLLQLTSPLREATDISKTFERYKAMRRKVAVSVTPVNNGDQTNGETFVCSCNWEISIEAHCNEARPVVPNGAVYFIHDSEVPIGKPLDLEGAGAWLMPKNRSLDIDFKYQLTEMDHRR